MVRWRLILFLSILVVAQVAQVTCTKDAKEDEDDDEDITTVSDEDNDDEEEEVTSRRQEPSTTAARLTRTTSGAPLLCYVCSYKSDGQKNCLDPQRRNVSTAYCRTASDKCFTAVEMKDSGVSIVVRGCKSACVSSPDIICCESDRCNSQVVGRQPHFRAVSVNNAPKSLPQSVLYFVTVLLLLQAVVKVNIM